jgi:hypothetical protein
MPLTNPATAFFRFVARHAWALVKRYPWAACSVLCALAWGYRIVPSNWLLVGAVAWPARYVLWPLVGHHLDPNGGEATRLASALAHVGITEAENAPPEVLPHDRLGHGSRFVVTLPRLCSMDDLRRTEAAWLPVTGATAVEYAHTAPTRDHRPRLLVTLRHADPLAVPPAGPWPLCPDPAAPPARNASDPWPLGVMEDGSVLSVSLGTSCASLLIGGSPGSGKSIIQAAIAQAAMDPLAELFLIDLKGGVELNCWTARASGVAFRQAEATDLLERLVVLMDDRLSAMRLAGMRKAPLGPSWPPIVVAVDEAAELLRGTGDKRAGDALTSLIARGRAAGILAILATQKPTSDSLPTAVRDLLALRLCFRTGTREQAVAVLGDGFDPKRSPCDIPITARGLGYLVDEQATLQRVRCFWLPDLYLSALGASTAAARTVAVQTGKALPLSLPPAPVVEPKKPRGNNRRATPDD